MILSNSIKKFREDLSVCNLQSCQSINELYATVELCILIVNGEICFFRVVEMS